MNAAEAAVLLARISASDNREVSEAAARAWAESLPDVVLADALDYLPRFYRQASRDTKNWIYPGDVLMGVRALLDERCAIVMRAAGKAAIEGLKEDDEAVRDRGGLLAIETQARVAAGKEYQRSHPARPGAEIDLAEHRRQERQRNAWAYA